jgi:3-isopropylmalate/(R)-2-methylmalate dehydratase small subunit
MCLKYAGIQAIIGVSFARIFYRNAINQGLPVLACSSIQGIINEGDHLEIDIQTGKLLHTTTNKHIQCTPIPSFLLSILQAGGAVPWFLQKRRKH